MANDDAIADGRLAWTKIRSVTTYQNWKMVAVAVAIGRQRAMVAIGSNKPFGTKYRHAINSWLEDNGFREMRMGIRTACCLLADNLEEIESWRASLPASEQREQNHPEVIVRNWRKSKRTTMPRDMAAPRTPMGRLLPNPDQDTIRRIATALREAWTGDFYKLALVAHHVVMRPAPKPARRTAVDAELEATA